MSPCLWSRLALVQPSSESFLLLAAGHLVYIHMSKDASIVSQLDRMRRGNAVEDIETTHMLIGTCVASDFALVSAGNTQSSDSNPS